MERPARSITVVVAASGVVRRMCPCITGDWDSGNQALALLRGSCESAAYTSSAASRFPAMLWSPLGFPAR